ncbi:Peroxisomal targeting signal 2 receptor [Nymphon striatum]|nr:Peroxisomal targeting signal 2 receptor [Nymphon striatum]
MEKIAHFSTQNLHGYAINYSNILPDTIGCVCSANYGIAGPGTVYYIEFLPESCGKSVKSVAVKNWPSGLFDISCHPRDSPIFATSSADGSIQIWNKSTQHPFQKPVCILEGHKAEIYSVRWNQHFENILVSGSWDNTAVVWDTLKAVPVEVMNGHTDLVYASIWSPNDSKQILTASGDRTARVWDISCGSKSVVTLKNHTSEVLTCDWSKLNQNVVVTGSVDKSIAVWDMRSTSAPLKKLLSHNFAVKSVKCSPHEETVVASSSYDFTTRIWNFSKSSNPSITLSYHKEFVYDIDFHPFNKGEIADCSWDKSVFLYSPIDMT